LSVTVQCNLCGTPMGESHPPVWHKDGHDVVRCDSCALLFRRDLPAKAEVLEIYRDSYFRGEEHGDATSYADYLRDAPEHRLTARRRLARLGPAPAGGRLLDIGCAAGFFMDEARQQGWDARGIDVSAEMTAWGREHLHLDIATGLVQDATYPPGSFECVTMWDYIEHSIDPAADFAKAASVLAPGGRLLLSTGDSASLVARCSGSRWHLLTPEHHNFFFTPETLSDYLRRNGFEAITVSRPPAYYSVRYIAHKLGTMAPGSRALKEFAKWMGRRRLGERAVPLNLFDIVTVEARLPAALGP
jgi:SAM-dependent methyltransferase